MDSSFRYSTGEVILPGDRVISEDMHFGVVESISLPGSELAILEGHPEGGVSVAENVGGMSSGVYYTPKNEEGVMIDWQLRFITRGTVILPPYGSGTTPWLYESGSFNGGIRQREGPLSDDEKRSK